MEHPAGGLPSASCRFLPPQFLGAQVRPSPHPTSPPPPAHTLAHPSPAHPAASPNPLTQKLDISRRRSRGHLELQSHRPTHPLLPSHTSWREERRVCQTRRVLLGGESLPRPVSPRVPSGSLASCRLKGATGMGVSAAPGPSSTTTSPERPWLEALGAFYYVLTFLFMGVFVSLLFLFLFFTPFWFLSVIYLLWLYLDWDTPRRGGRKSKWVKNWTFWKLQRNYFPVKLVKTAELPPDQNYVIGAHPHGILAMGLFNNFCTESNGFSQQFPGIRCSLCGMASLFYFPLFREYLLSLGFCSVSRESMDFILSQSQGGQAVVIVVGGAQEAIHAIPDKHYVVLQKRKGFVSLALRHGASLVPVYTFGENNVFKIKTYDTDSWQHLCQMAFKKLTRIAPCIFWGRSFFSANSWGLLPYAKPLTTVVGGPIPVPRCLNPTEEKVDHYHALYMKALEQLFEEHKESFGVPASTHITFI